jgi:hypothetical protein
MAFEVGLRGTIGYQLRRLRDAWWGSDLANLRRLEKKGRVIRGVHTYGIPVVWTFPYEEQTKLIIGNYSAVAGTHLLGGQHAIKHVSSYPFRINWKLPGAGEDGNPAAPRGDIVIGSDAWVTFGTWVLSGVNIGHGAVVATGSVVSKDVPPYAIVGGNPAEIIRYRHTPEQIEALLEIAWWDWPEEEVREAVPYQASDSLLDTLENRYSTGRSYAPQQMRNPAEVELVQSGAASGASERAAPAAQGRSQAQPSPAVSTDVEIAEDENNDLNLSIEDNVIRELARSLRPQRR